MKVMEFPHRFKFVKIPSSGNIWYSLVRQSDHWVIYYYGALWYDNLSFGPSHLPGNYGECSLAVPMKHFAQLALQLQFQTDCKHYFWIFPAPLCAMCLINDALYTGKEAVLRTA